MFIATLATLWSAAASAQEPVAAGTVFSVKDISTADGYYAQKASLVGKECTASGQLTVTPGTTWYGGPATCTGSTYYFYQVAIDKKAVFGSATASTMLPGTTFVVKDIASDDAYATTRSTILGVSCTAGSGMSRTDGAWWAGPAKCGEKDYYFYKVAFDVTGAAPITGGLSSATVNALPAGSAFVVRDVHAEDAYASEKTTLVGTSCTAGADMYRTEGAWWAGSATCNNTSYYFYKMAFDVTSLAGAAASTWGSATAAGTLYPPTQVIIRDIGTDDIYAAQRALLVGQTCSVAAELHRNDAQWYGGDVNCANGSYYYFYKVAFDVVGTANVAPTSGFGSATAPTSLMPPTQFIVRDIAPDDAYFPSASTLVGQTCTVNGDLHRQDGQWYGGAANCGPDATYYYFYKVAFDLVGGASAGYGSASAPESLTQGTSLTIREVAADDGYASSAGSIVGLTCTVGSSGMTRTTGAYYGGDVNCSDGNYYYFYKVAFDLGASTGGATTAGTMISVLDIAPDDAYYSDRAGIIGQSCTVVSGLTPTEGAGDWYGGDVNCSNGSYYYFYKMKYAIGGGGGVATPTGGRYSGYSIPKNAWVTVADVSPDDAFYPYKDSLIGQSCQVKKGELTSTGEAWFGGTIKCNGSKLYFYQVGVIY